MDRINQYEPVYGKEEAEAAYNYIMRGGWCSDFTYTRQLENMIKEFTGAQYCLIVNSGTTALQIAIMAINPSKVIVPDYTMPATAYAANLCGIPVQFVDVDTRTYNMQLGDYLSAIGSCVMPVHINGRACPMVRKLTIIEDACQAMHCWYQGKHLGTHGTIGVLSLNVFKLISTGQGGVLLTDDGELYTRMKKIKDYGRIGGRGAEYEVLGMNAKFNDLLAVIGIEQFKKIDNKAVAKQRLWAWYTELLADVEQVHFINTDLSDCTPWYIDPLVVDRDKLIAYLTENGIETQPFYPPLHQLKYYRELGYSDRDFPGACKVSSSGIWLPSSTNLTEDTVEMICEKIRRFYR